jgi:hypothetical protein
MVIEVVLNLLILALLVLVAVRCPVPHWVCTGIAWFFVGVWSWQFAIYIWNHPNGKE